LGARHRFVVAHQEKTGYKTAPGQPLPAFAVVLEMREPNKFARTAESLLRTGAILASSQTRLKLTEEEHGDHTITGYRFAEDSPLPADTNNLRFNFSPCFVRVGNLFVLSSTLKLGHDLIDVLEKEAKAAASVEPAPARLQLYGAGAVALAASFEDQL